MPKQLSGSPPGAGRSHQLPRIAACCATQSFEAYKSCSEDGRKSLRYPGNVEHPAPGRWLFRSGACDPSQGLSSLSSPNLPARHESTWEGRTGDGALSWSNPDPPACSNGWKGEPVLVRG